MMRIRDELIVSRNYRMPIYRDFQHIEEYIISNLPYRVSRYAFILSFSAENSPKNPIILWKFRKFSENSENSQKFLKIRRKFIKKKVFLWGPDIVSYRIVSRKKPSYRIDIVSSRKKAYRYWLLGTESCKILKINIFSHRWLSISPVRQSCPLFLICTYLRSLLNRLLKYISLSNPSWI